MTATSETTQTDSAIAPSDASDKPSYEDLNVPVILLIGAVSAVITYVSIVFVQGLFYQWDSALKAERQYGYSTSPYQEQIDNQQEALTVYRVDKKEKVAIPIGRAMEMVVEKFEKNSAKPETNHKASNKHATQHAENEQSESPTPPDPEGQAKSGN